MIEITGNATVLRAIQKAHAARAEAVQDVWGWLFGRRVSR